MSPSSRDLSNLSLSVVVCSLGEATTGEMISSVIASAEAARADVEVILVWQAPSPPPELEGNARVLLEAPIGISQARNRGLEAAQAALVAFVDDDELVDRGWVAALLDGFARHPASSALFGPVAPRDERGLPYCHYEGSEARSFSGSVNPWVVGTGGNMAFRSDQLRELGGFDPRFGAGSSGHAAEETDLIVRTLRTGATIEWVPEMVAYHPTKSETEHLASRYPYAFGMGRMIRRHRALVMGLKYLLTIIQTYARGDRRRRRETLPTLRGYLAGLATLLPATEPPAVIPPVESEPALEIPPEAQPADAAAATTGATVFSGGLWQTASAVLPQAYVLVQSVIAARFLGPSGMGVQSLIAFTALSLTALLSQGFSVALMRFIGETRGRGRPDQLRDLVRWGWIVEGVAALVGAGALVIVALAGGTPRAAWLIVAFVCAIGILHTIPTAVLIGAQRFRQASLVGLVTAPVATAGMVVALALGGGITGMFAVEAVVASVNMIWTTALSRRTLAGLSVEATRSPALRRQAGTFALLMTYSSLLTFIVWRRSELFFLQRYSTHSEIALYSIAFSAMTALVAIPAAISTVISPAVATLFGAGAWERIGRGYGRGLRLLLLATLPLTAGALAVGPALIQLVYGSAYSGTAPILLILLLPLPLIPLVNLGRAFLAGLGRLHFQLAVGTVAAFINFGFDFLLIPAHGAVGAAIANASAQVVAGVPLFLYASRIVGGVRWEIGAIARTTVASAATGLAAWTIVSILDGAAGVVGGVASGIAVFLILAKTLRILSPEDAAWLEVVVGGRFGGRLGRTVRGWSMQPAATRG